MSPRDYGGITIPQGASSVKTKNVVPIPLPERRRFYFARLSRPDSSLDQKPMDSDDKPQKSSNCSLANLDPVRLLHLRYVVAGPPGSPIKKSNSSGDVTAHPEWRPCYLPRGGMSLKRRAELLGYKHRCRQHRLSGSNSRSPPLLRVEASLATKLPSRETGHQFLYRGNYDQH